MTTAALLLTMGSAISVVMFGANEMLTAAAHAGAVEQLNEIQWAVFPLGGALMAAAMAFLFRKDSWRAVLGQIIGAVVAGVGIPRLITYIHPALKEWSLDPILIFGFGFVWGLIGYACAKAAVTYSFSKGPKTMEMEADSFLHRREKNLRNLAQDAPTERLEP